ncbi:hypothetical protein GCM10022394_15690 [Zobellella aerophila]|uniref:Uncharacterized protein n=1 Tax=Zobellella aerophila TaxID=870480 RepID=A0ABP6VMY4_9GAMM
MQVAGGGGGTAALGDRHENLELVKRNHYQKIIYLIFVTTILHNTYRLTNSNSTKERMRECSDHGTE